MCFEQTCIVYLIVRPSVWSSVRREDVSRDKKMYFEQTCVVYLIIWLSAVEGSDSRQEDMHFEQFCAVY